MQTPSPWKFSCEWKPDIPLPPDYTFPQAFNYLNADTNSFYILQHEKGNYIQCGGSKIACCVEVRIYADGGAYKHFFVGHKSGSDEPAVIKMSAGVVNVRQREVLSHWEAVTLFKCFYAKESFPSEYSLRKTDI